MVRLFCASRVFQPCRLSPAGAPGDLGEGDGDGAELAAARVARLDHQHLGIVLDDLGEAGQVLVGIEQHRQRRIVDRPALPLADVIVDEGQRAAVADDQHVGAAAIIEADMAGAADGERAGERAAAPAALGEARGHRVDRAQMRLHLGEAGRRRLGVKRDRHGGGEQRRRHKARARRRGMRHSFREQDWGAIWRAGA